jgi:hypothetical protein
MRVRCIGRVVVPNKLLLTFGRLNFAIQSDPFGLFVNALKLLIGVVAG